MTLAYSSHLIGVLFLIATLGCGDQDKPKVMTTHPKNLGLLKKTDRVPAGAREILSEPIKRGFDARDVRLSRDRSTILVDLQGTAAGDPNDIDFKTSFFDPRTGSLKQDLEVEVDSFSWSPDGERVVVTTSRTPRISNAEHEASKLGPPSIAPSSAAITDMRLRKSGEANWAWISGASLTPVLDVQFCSDGREILSVEFGTRKHEADDFSKLLNAPFSDGPTKRQLQFKYWNSKTGELSKIVNGPTLQSPAALVKDEATIVAVWSKSSADRGLQICSPLDGRVLHTLGVGGRAIRAVAFATGSPRIAVADASDKDEMIRIWNTDSGEEIQRITASAFAVAFSPDGKLLLAGANTEEVSANNVASDPGLPPLNLSMKSWQPQTVVTVWNSDNGKELRRIETQLKPNGGMGFISNHEVFTSGWTREMKSRPRIYVWDLRD